MSNAASILVTNVCFGRWFWGDAKKKEPESDWQSGTDPIQTNWTLATTLLKSNCVPLRSSWACSPLFVFVFFFSFFATASCFHRKSGFPSEKLKIKFHFVCGLIFLLWWDLQSQEDLKGPSVALSWCSSLLPVCVLMYKMSSARRSRAPPEEQQHTTSHRAITPGRQEPCG